MGGGGDGGGVCVCVWWWLHTLAGLEIVKTQTRARTPTGLTTGPNQNAPSQILSALAGDGGTRTGLPAALCLLKYFT